MITQEYAFILKTFIFRLKPQIEDKQVIATHENLYGKKYFLVLSRNPFPQIPHIKPCSLMWAPFPGKIHLFQLLSALTLCQGVNQPHLSVCFLSVPRK